MAHREGGDARALPGDDLIAELPKRGTGLRPYQAPEEPKLSWWQRRKQRKELERAAANSLKPNIVHTPARGVQPK